MDINTLPIKEAVVTPNLERKKEEITPIYWFEREDGIFIPTKEKEAWEIIKGRIQVMNGKISFKYLGKSSGKFYWEEIKKVPEVFKNEGQDKATEFIKEIERKERDSLDPTIRPRNFDGMDLGKNPVSMNLGGLI